MIVFCGGMLRSGSTLQFQIAYRLLEVRKICRRWAYLESGPLETKLSGLKGERIKGVIKTHVLTPTIRSLLAREDARAFYCFRDLRDVAASGMKAFGYDWATFKSKQLLPLALAEEQQWRAQPCVLVQRYEQFVLDLPGAVADIAAHLELELKPGEAAALAKKLSLDRQKKAVKQWKPNPSFPTTQHIDQGEIGAWRHKMSSAVADEITTQYAGWLNNHGYPLVSLPEKALGRDELCYVPHCGWLAYEPGDAVLTGLRDGNFEFAEQAFFHRVLRPGDTVVDCGAHAGLYTRLAAPRVSPGGHVHAIEPAPHTFDRLQRNTADLPAGSCVLHALALGGASGKIDFIARDDGLSAYNHVAAQPHVKGAISVSQLTLPAFFEDNDLSRVDFIKIDAEGQEVAILQAAAPLLRRGAIGALMIEFNQENLTRYGSSCRALMDFLAEYNYQIFAVDRAQFRLIPALPSEQEGYANYIVARDSIWLQERFASASTEAQLVSADIMQHGTHVTAQVRRLHTTLAEQATYIDASARNLAEMQQHIDSLLIQLRQLSATSLEQAAYIETLKKELERLERTLARQTAEGAHYTNVITQQTAYIALLEKQRNPDSPSSGS